MPLQYLRLRPSPSSSPPVRYSLVIFLFSADSPLSNELSTLIKAVYSRIWQYKVLQSSAHRVLASATTVRYIGFEKGALYSGSVVQDGALR
jgi:hypothetical protein